jgi:hypothetical protein
LTSSRQPGASSRIWRVISKPGSISKAHNATSKGAIRTATAMILIQDFPRSN